MGYDCTNHFPPKTRQKDVEDFLFLLGYEKGEKGSLDEILVVSYFFSTRKTTNILKVFIQNSILTQTLENFRYGQGLQYGEVSSIVIFTTTLSRS